MWIEKVEVQTTEHQGERADHGASKVNVQAMEHRRPGK
jgi:hypothetical protein